jgi:hypothetical protein
VPTVLPVELAVTVMTRVALPVEYPSGRLWPTATATRGTGLGVAFGAAGLTAGGLLVVLGAAVTWLGGFGAVLFGAVFLAVVFGVAGAAFDVVLGAAGMVAGVSGAAFRGVAATF